MSARFLVNAWPPGKDVPAPIRLESGDTLHLTLELTATEPTTLVFAEMTLLERTPERVVADRGEIP